MDIEIIKAIILGIVQGITEWLPVSSTGHLILVEQFIKFNLPQSFVNTFFVFIQFGSILAVVTMYFSKLNPFDTNKDYMLKYRTIDLWKKIIVASIPSGVLGFLFDDLIQNTLYSPTTVSIMLIIYGILFISIENREIRPQITEFSQLKFTTAFGIGVFQSLALIPGTSRSGATILGAILLGTSRSIAAEFSFYLAVPIMFSASGYKLLKAGIGFNMSEWLLLLVGAFAAFCVSIIVIKFLIEYIKKHDFKVFGYYRIMLGILILAYFYVFKS